MATVSIVGAYLLLAGVELGLVLQSEAELRVAVDRVDIRGEESRGEISVAIPTSPPEATATKKNLHLGRERHPLCNL